MLRSNVDVARGLVNGAIGKIRGFTRASHSGKITSLQIVFDGSTETVDIKPVRRKVQIFPGAFLHREQFPVCSSYAMTVHKSQGLSLPCALIDIGRTIFAPSQTYVALSRVSTLEGLHLINFDHKKILINNASLAEYIRLGSKSGVSREDRKKTHSKNSKGLKSFSLPPERIWYICATRKKAADTIGSKLKDMGSKKKRGRSDNDSTTDTPIGLTGRGKTKAGKKNPTRTTNIPTPSPNVTCTKPPKPGKARVTPSTTTRNVQLSFIHIPVDVERSVDEIIRQATLCLGDDNLLMSRDTMINTYFSGVVPFCDRQSDVLARRVATELQPDPFGVANSTRQKWLSSDLINLYGMYLRDLARSLNGPSVYYLSSYARFSYKDNPRTCVAEYIKSAHATKPYSSYLDLDGYQHSYQSAINICGDPLEQDIILNFCNDSTLGHWYLLILDNRPDRRTITMYDSGCRISRNVLRERCTYLIDFINKFRRHVTSEYSLDWDRSQVLTSSQFRFDDGLSTLQNNSFDCGVYSLLNAECFVRSWNGRLFTQNTLPLVRLYMIRNIYTFASTVDLRL